MLVTSIFSFSQNVFYLSQNKFQYFQSYFNCRLQMLRIRTSLKISRLVKSLSVNSKCNRECLATRGKGHWRKLPFRISLRSMHRLIRDGTLRLHRFCAPVDVLLLKTEKKDYTEMSECPFFACCKPLLFTTQSRL